MFNKTIIQGHIGKNAEISTTDNGKVCRFSVAINSSWKDKYTGDWQNKTIWVPVICFQEALIEKVLASRAKKGAHVLIDGEIKDFDYTDADNIRRIGIEVMIGYQGRIEFLPSKPKDENPHDDAGAA